MALASRPSWLADSSPYQLRGPCGPHLLFSSLFLSYSSAVTRNGNRLGPRARFKFAPEACRPVQIVQLKKGKLAGELKLRATGVLVEAFGGPFGTLGWALGDP